MQEKADKKEVDRPTEKEEQSFGNQNGTNQETGLKTGNVPFGADSSYDAEGGGWLGGTP